jgi:DNA-binding beta-propeller fold protein YncE
MELRRSSPASPARTAARLALALVGIGACTGVPNELPRSGLELFEGPVVAPLAISADGDTLVRVNPLHATVTVIDLTEEEPAYDIPVGLEPVSAAFRPKATPNDPDVVLVANHVSDSVSVIDLGRRNVVQTIQGVDEHGVATTNEPTGIAFAGPGRAFVTLDQPDQVIVLDAAAPDAWSIHPIRLRVTAQGPRALAVAGGRLYVASFESGNKTVTASCGHPSQVPFPCSTVLAPEAVVLPIAVDPAAPDRDLFVFEIAELDAPAPPLDPDGFLRATQIVEGVGTLLYGMAATPAQRIFVTHTDALNEIDGDVRLLNRMFDNRLARIDCAPACGAPALFDLDQAAGMPVPTPYGVAVSQDGATLVVTAAGADATIAMPGLFVLDADDGSVLGVLPVGSIPQGVVLHSDPSTGAARTAYVWNSSDGSVSVVDVSVPASPTLAATLAGPDPVLPPIVELGRLAFRSARASSSHTFSCESCHPNGHIDQLVWTLNAPGEPQLGQGARLAGPEDPESRVTLSIRGLRDTLPLHWDGTLGKPTAPPGNVEPVPQSCAFTETMQPGIDFSCFLDLVEASLAGVMCDFEDCPVTEGKPGELNAIERVGVAAYINSVAPQPSSTRRPDDRPSEEAIAGVEFLNGLAPPLGSCSATGRGCHELPHGAPPEVARNFAAQPGPWRTMWDRFLLGSNGGVSSNADLVHPSFQPVTGYDPQLGMSERASFRSFVHRNFFIADTEIIDRMFDFTLEIGAGYSGLLGRQLTLSPAMVQTAPQRAAVLAEIQVFEQAAEEGRINAVGYMHQHVLGEVITMHGAYDTAIDRWVLEEETTATYPTDQLLNYLRTMPAATRATIRADLPANVGLHVAGFSPSGYRQPVLWFDSPTLSATRLLATLGPPSVPLRVRVLHVAAATPTAVLVDGQRCATCSLVFDAPPVPGDPHNATIQLALDGLTPGTHTLQIHPDRGWISNEAPLVVAEGP